MCPPSGSRQAWAAARAHPLARGMRRAVRGRGLLGPSELGRRASELFGAACGAVRGP